MDLTQVRHFASSPPHYIHTHAVIFLILLARALSVVAQRRCHTTGSSHIMRYIYVTHSATHAYSLVCFVPHIRRIVVSFYAKRILHDVNNNVYIELRKNKWSVLSDMLTG